MTGAKYASLSALASKSLAAYKLSRGGPLVPFPVKDFAVFLGLEVLHADLLSDGILGMLKGNRIWMDRGLKAPDFYPVYRFTLAHECAHYLFRSMYGRPCGEKTADVLASMLLLPKEEIVSLAGPPSRASSLTDAQIKTIAKLFAVSFCAAKVRLSTLGYRVPDGRSDGFQRRLPYVPLPGRLPPFPISV